MRLGPGARSAPVLLPAEERVGGYGKFRILVKGFGPLISGKIAYPGGANAYLEPRQGTRRRKARQIRGVRW
jgi:hypothetical protein